MHAVKKAVLPNYPGKLIVFEGIDGSGKSTCLDQVMSQLRTMAIPFTKIDMLPPGRIRELVLWDDTFTPKQRLLLLKIEGDRARTKALDALRLNQLVFCDRGQFAPLAYQGYGYGLMQEHWTLGMIFDAFPDPDKVFLFDLEPEVALRRIATNRRKLDLIEKHALDYHKRVRQGYLETLKPSKIVTVLDATQSQEAIFDQVFMEVLETWSKDVAIRTTPAGFDSSLQ